MRKIKTIFSTLLVLCMICAFIPAYAATGTSVFEATTSAVNIGDEFTVNVNLTPGDGCGVSAISITVEHSDNIELTAIESQDMGGLDSSKLATKKIGMMATSPIEESGTYYTLTFKALSAGTATISATSASYVTYKDTKNTKVYEFTPASVTVNAPVVDDPTVDTATVSEGYTTVNGTDGTIYNNVWVGEYSATAEDGAALTSMTVSFKDGAKVFNVADHKTVEGEATLEFSIALIGVPTSENLAGTVAATAAWVSAN